MSLIDVARMVPKGEEVATTLKGFAEDLLQLRKAAPSTVSNELLGKFGLEIDVGTPLKMVPRENDGFSIMMGGGNKIDGLLPYQIAHEDRGFGQSKLAKEFLVSKDGIKIVSDDGQTHPFQLNPSVNMADRLKAVGVDVHQPSKLVHGYDKWGETIKAKDAGASFTLTQLLPGNDLLVEKATQLRILPNGEIQFTSPNGHLFEPHQERKVFDLRSVMSVRNTIKGSSVPSYEKV